MLRALAVLMAMTLLGLGGLAAWSQRRPSLGLVEGQLRPCPPTPNATCTREPHSPSTAPLRFEGAPERAWSRLVTAVTSLPRTKIVTDEGDYLWAEVRSPLWRFVDDLEFQLDPDGSAIHARAAARVGGYDFGACRRHIEAVRAQYQKSD